MPIAIEIMEAFGRTRISGEARQILDIILRKTYGFHKKSDAISISQFFEAAGGMKKPSICRAIHHLVSMNIISEEANVSNNANIYAFNKDFDSWKPLAKKLIVSEKAKKRLQKRKQSLAKKLYTIDKRKKIKDNAANAAEPPSKKKQAKDDDTPLSVTEYVKKMKESPQRHIRIIGDYAEQIAPRLQTRAQWYIFTARNVRAARALAPFTDDQISDAYVDLQKDVKKPSNPKGFITKWTLETLLKYLTDHDNAS